MPVAELAEAMPWISRALARGDYEQALQRLERALDDPVLAALALLALLDRQSER